MLTTTQATLLLVAFFLIGILFHVLLRAGFAYRSQVSTFPTRLSFVQKNWDTILIRTFLNSILFWVWMTHPDAISIIVNHMGVNPDIGNWLTVPVSLGTASIFGFFVDVILDSVQSVIAGIPQLAWLNKYVKGQIPTYNQNIVDALKLEHKDK